MFLKRINAKSKEGKKRAYWALVKSVRTARGPRHQVVSYLGELQAGEKSEWAMGAELRNGPRAVLKRRPPWMIPVDMDWTRADPAAARGSNHASE